MGHSTLVGSWQGKYWGRTKCLFANDMCELHIIEAKAGGYCSRHHHKNKWNRFIILKGELDVIIYRENGEDLTELCEGMFSDVPPLQDHRFTAKTDCVALEVYWVDGIDPKDIVRKDVGGLTEVEKMGEIFKK